MNYEYKKHIPKDYRKIIIYSCLIGNYDKVATFKRQKGYDYILFTDQKIENTNWTLYPIPKEVLKLKVNPIDIIYICHLQFGRGLHKAIQTAIDQKLDKKSILMETMRRYNESKILGKQGIVNAGLIIRKHHEKECIKLMEKWWEEIEQYSHVDNIAFNYAGYMTKVRFLYISYQFTLDYFGHSKHLKKRNYS